jgi:hypothetical protein
LNWRERYESFNAALEQLTSGSAKVSRHTFLWHLEGVQRLTTSRDERSRRLEVPESCLKLGREHGGPSSVVRVPRDT